MDNNWRTRTLLIACVAAIAGLLFGFDTGVISGAILFINKDFQLNHFQTELVISCVLLGALIGAASSGRLCDQVGRKKLLLLTSLIFCIGTLLCGFASGVHFLILGRFILGLAIGIASYTAPLYLAELAPANIRGLLVGLNQLAITIGILGSYLIDYYYAPTGEWRMMLLAGIIPALVLFIGTLYLPESPRFLITIGKERLARKILAKLRPQASVNEEIIAIKRMSAHHYHWKTLFTNKQLLKVFSVGVALASIQQFAGINTIIYYAPTIFNMAGFGSNSAIFITAIVGLTNMLTTIMGMPLIDRLGRRKLLFIGLIGMTLSLFLIGYGFQATTLSQSMKYLIAMSALIYIASFAISLGPMVFLLLSEMFPQQIRGVAMSLSMSANWLSNMLVALTFLSLIDTLGKTDTFYLYAIINVACMIFVYFFIPETKGTTLEQIENNLYAGVPCRYLGSPDSYYHQTKKRPLYVFGK